MMAGQWADAAHTVSHDKNTHGHKMYSGESTTSEMSSKTQHRNPNTPPPQITHLFIRKTGNAPPHSFQLHPSSKNPSDVRTSEDKSIGSLTHTHRFSPLQCPPPALNFSLCTHLYKGALFEVLIQLSNSVGKLALCPKCFHSCRKPLYKGPRNLLVKVHVPVVIAFEGTAPVVIAV